MMNENLSGFENLTDCSSLADFNANSLCSVSVRLFFNSASRFCRVVSALLLKIVWNILRKVEMGRELKAIPWESPVVDRSSDFVSVHIPISYQGIQNVFDRLGCDAFLRYGSFLYFLIIYT